ncbi:MAG TPA: hypothetical protein VGI70_03740 [Polyangiales bacterium]
MLCSARPLRALCLALALCASYLAPARVQAETTVGVDLFAVAPIDSNYHKAGGGFGIRLGEELHLPLLAVVPEVGFTYASFATSGLSVYRGIVGLRAGIGEIIRFGALAHVGFGQLSVDSEPALHRVGEANHLGFTMDGGLFLELTLLPLINIGVHAIYNRLEGRKEGDALQWMQFGVHAALVF